jgi:Arc/MetJ-type ribon-helix-helix transcriptional regulator
MKVVKMKNLRITVRFEAPTRTQIEQLIKQGKFKNISQLVRIAVTEFLENEKQIVSNVNVA